MLQNSHFTLKENDVLQIRETQLPAIFSVCFAFDILVQTQNALVVHIFCWHPMLTSISCNSQTYMYTCRLCIIFTKHSNISCDYMQIMKIFPLTARHNEIKILEKPNEIDISLHIFTIINDKIEYQCLFKYQRIRNNCHVL